MLSRNLLLAALSATLSAAAPSSPVRRSMDVNKFLGAIVKAFPDLDAGIGEVCGLITKGEEALANAFNIATSSNRGDSCSDVSVIFARGTCDPGNVGSLVGPPLFDALGGALGGKSLSIQGVEYPASVDGYLNADPAAGHTMADLVRSTADACPDTKIVIGGYSQGGYAVHNAATDLGGDMSKVSAAIIFGDPMSHQPLDNIDASRVKVFCHDGDDICNTGAIILLQHLTYAENAAEAASFIASHV